MVDLASRKSPQGQRQPYPVAVHALPLASDPASQSARLQQTEAAFQLQYVAMPPRSPQQTSMQTHQAYTVYMPAGQQPNSMNMGQLSQALPAQYSGQPAYFYPQQQQQQQSAGHHPQSSLVASRPSFSPAMGAYHRQYAAPGMAAAPPPAGTTAYPHMAGAPLPQYGSFQAYQHNNFFYPGPPSGPAAVNNYMVSQGQMPGIQMQGHFPDAMYPRSQMEGQSFGGAYTSSPNCVPSHAYSPDLSSPPSVSRGPPRKPRQSGHALWVGNLPSGASVVDMKNHFSREATEDIESVKLISKSNCAFVNYKTQTACVAAMQRFHDSRFYGIRLVCRLRRTSAPNSSIASASTSTSPDSLPVLTPKHGSPDASLSTSSSDGVSGTESATRVAARYFILKSLTLQDLEASTSTGIWATQAHNEDALNAAYKSAEDVYLIFSANKSGEYFGYARMSSAIPAADLDEAEFTEHVAAVESATAAVQPAVRDRASSSSSDMLNPSADPYQQQSSVEYAGPRSTPTDATEWAPRGRIIDDLARGTIFWEADAFELAEDEDQQLHDAVTTVADEGANKQPHDHQDRVSPASEAVVSELASLSQPVRPAALQTATEPAASTQYPVIARSPIDTINSVHLQLAERQSSSESSGEASTLATTAHAPSPQSSTSATAPPSASPSSLQSPAMRPRQPDNSDEASSRGNPLRIEWLSVRRVPFYRTRGLRNALNNNREVKIARDGTEVESGVGGRLLVLFGGSFSVGPGRGGGAGTDHM